MRKKKRGLRSSPSSEGDANVDLATSAFPCRGPVSISTDLISTLLKQQQRTWALIEQSVRGYALDVSAIRLDPFDP
jgi:hypothetical protein